MNTVAPAQRGQALVEATLILGLLVGLMWALRATGVWQDETLRAGLAARQAAFAYSRFAPDPGNLDDNAQVNWIRAAHLSEAGQPGGAHRHAGVLRRQWQLGEINVVAAQVTVPLSLTSQADGSRVFKRYTAILRGAGHSGGDAQTQQRVASAALAWQTVANRSSAVGRTVAARLNPLDAAWQRAQPGFDWLSDWTAVVPPVFLSAQGARAWK